MQEIKIHKDRISVLIGVKGKTKRELQKKTNTKIEVNSKEGEVTIESEDPLAELITKTIIQAIGRGFNPKKALLLLQENYHFEVINIKDFVRDTKNDIERVKARIIGTKGKAWKTIEMLTNTDISVYGKTVCVIGDADNVLVAKQAIENLLKGAPHGNVYAFIEHHKKTTL